MQNLLTIRTLAAAILIVSAMTIGGAYIFQYGFNILPCEVCLWQRPSYFIAIAAAIAILGLEGRAGARSYVLALFALIAVAVVVNAGIGVYHAGVEWKFWPGPGACGGGQGIGTGDLLEQLENAAVIRCDEAAWRFLGLSLAGYNVLISGALAALALLGLTRARQGRSA